MTFEEAKNIFLNRGYVEVPGGTYYDADKWREAITVISKWLEQEPCDDCISRQEAILQVQRYGVGCFDAEEFSPEQCERFVIQKLNDLPPVAQKEKTGKWIDQSGGDPTDFSVSCNLCNEWVSQSTNFCPNCGARMEIKNDNG